MQSGIQLLVAPSLSAGQMSIRIIFLASLRLPKLSLVSSGSRMADPTLAVSIPLC